MLQLKVPPPIYAFAIATLMWLLSRFLPVVSIFSDPWNKFGWVFVVSGLVIDLWSVGLFWKHKTTVNPLKPDNSKRIVVDGMYQYSRNPMYLGMLSILLGIAILLGSLSALLCLPLFIALITTQQIIPEEMILTDKFGQEYLDYKRQVRRWL
jgi:protein-S-isoprenylcysteine O-methyltransferase Ste14